MTELKDVLGHAGENPYILFCLSSLASSQLALDAHAHLSAGMHPCRIYAQLCTRLSAERLCQQPCSYVYVMFSVLAILSFPGFSFAQSSVGS